MKTLRVILGDQLSATLPSLQSVTPNDTILMCEVMAEATYVPHHPKKIAFLFAAMRHFAAELAAGGLTVRYVKLDDPGNTGDFAGEIKRAISATAAEEVVITEPGEYRVLQLLQALRDEIDIPLSILPNTRFLCSINEFKAWAGDKKQLRMEFFYREMRRRYKILLEKDGAPTGGEWNFDKENRKSPPKGLAGPKRISHSKDDITHQVLDLVERRFANHFGTLKPFHYAVTREEALIELDHFITHLLPHFGDYQDAMVAGEPYLYHSLLSSYLNAGLLLPLEVCQMAESAYRTGAAPLNAVEGFIRQILGWREYVRGIYWLKMPGYGAMNYLDAHTPLPSFYWGTETNMVCMAEAVRHTRDHAYSHHIQRLMITGNFALLAGLDVQHVQEWYLAVYSDAYEWVEMPNTLGMALFGDGGIMASKPYAASGKYINRMSNFCERCKYDPEETTTPNACPFNALYWDFIARNESKLKSQQRLAFAYKNWDRFEPKKQKDIRAKAQSVLKAMHEGAL
jgi:deoxyribodipyrimidine photolyase-related protein